MTVLLNQSGTVSVKIADDNQNGFKGAIVSIYSSGSAGGRIYFDSTDTRGICAVGKVLQGQYEYYISAKKDNKTYRLRECFQVIAGENKILDLNPFSNVGTIKVRVMNAYLETESIADVNVALIPHPNYNLNYSFQELIEEAYAIGKTNSEGWVEFQNMPVLDTDYSVLVYFDGGAYDYPTYNNYVNATKNSTEKFTIKVHL